MKTKVFALISLSACLLAGCADTPENRAIAEGLASGMQSAGQALANDAAEKRRALREDLRDSQQQVHQPKRPTNCVTRYESLTKEYITQCN